MDSSLPRVSRLLVEVVPAINRTLRSLVAHRSLPAFTLPQYRVLVQLGENPLLSLKDLAEREGVAPPTMSRTVDALVDKGWAERETNPRDRRAVRLTLTAEGAVLVNQVRSQVSAEVQRLLAGWTPEALSELEGALSRLRTSSLHPSSTGVSS